jgi:alpha-L-fucosidase 2
MKNMKSGRIVLGLAVSLLCFVTSCDKKSDSSDTVLWYDEPAANWNEALPLGNGRMGAMVFGGIDEEHLQLNENTLYSGEPSQN